MNDLSERSDERGLAFTRLGFEKGRLCRCQDGLDEPTKWLSLHFNVTINRSSVVFEPYAGILARCFALH